MASDGMFDNLYDEDVHECITKVRDPINQQFDVLAASDCLARKALWFGDREDYLSPFAKGAREAGKRYPAIGKSDDIVVVVAQIERKTGQE